ncbi:hypothetical protein AB0D67_21185 [Streptosporangium sp. NPDC048047]|uniref:hypothetical protein n=1 Tax=Streptosporangium sp. NPDC048047 TaxID=3155748 RepID=UPI00343A568D
MDDDERVLSPQEMLRLIEQQETAAAERFTPNPVPHFLAWGVAWLAGFGALFLSYGLSGRPYAPVPIWTALVVLWVLTVAALVISAATMWQLRSPVRGASQERGTRYGMAWGLGFLGVWTVGIRFGQLLPPAETGLLWAGLSMMTVAMLYVAGGAVWNDRTMYLFGAGLAVLNAAGVMAGPGWHSLLMAAGGGGGSIVAGLLLRRARHR